MGDSAGDNHDHHPNPDGLYIGRIDRLCILGREEMERVTMPEPAMFNASGAGGVIRSHGYTTAQMEAYAAARVREAQAWQPFDTAPHGELCLFYDANALDVPGCMFTDWVVDGRFYGVRSRKATHWMSLPTHPAK